VTAIIVTFVVYFSKSANLYHREQPFELLNRGRVFEPTPTAQHLRFSYLINWRFEVTMNESESRYF